MKKFLTILLLLHLTTLAAQTDSGFVNSACGLFSPFQIDTERLLEEKGTTSSNTFVGGDILEVETALGSHTCNKMSNCIYLALKLGTSNSDIEKLKRPLNICVVLDRSGSMQENSRMNKFKEGLKEFMKLVSANDFVSIVIYDDNPSVIIPSKVKGSIHDLDQQIDNIALGGGTNIWAGMLAGYKEIEKHQNNNSVNRLILMTDGMSNVGVRSTKSILERSKVYNDKGIETSTMGLGKDINFEFLKDLAIQGRGLSHFIGDCESSHNDISNSLKEELYNFYPLIKDIELKFVTPKNVNLVEAEGIPNFNPNENKETFTLKNMGVSENKTLLMKFDVMGIPNNASIYIQTEVRFINTLTGTKEFVRTSERSIFNKKAKNKVNVISEGHIYNLYKTISVANSLKKAITLERSGKNDQAIGIVNACLRDLETATLPNTSGFKYIHGLLKDHKIYLDKILN